ncbi:hypothetical protein BGZ46_010832 [Entomortierella lignicola]|nr:hypothetical protein BGZ46_010832 [Entomortierella lignicola]
MSLPSSAAASSSAVATSTSIVPSTSTQAQTSAITTQPATSPASSVDPYPTTVSPDPGQPATTRAGGGGGKTKTTSRPTDTGTSSIAGPNPTNAPGNGSDNSDSKSGSSVIAPVVGSICGVLVVAFIVAVFVMRYRKKSKARKRRLDFLNDHTNSAGDAGFGGAGTSSQSQLPMQNITGRPATPVGGRSSAVGGGRPVEMGVIGGAGASPSPLHKGAYDYQQGYQQTPYGYQEQYEQSDQYDPYYAQHQGYEQQYQNQFAPAPIGGSPAMTHATASYPPPPPSTITAGHSSPRTPQQTNVSAVGNSYEKNAMIDNGYSGTHSSARNPQLVPENEDQIKVPI